MKKSHLYFLVAVAGAVMMAIEILGLQILRPFYGMSLYLWAIFITVTLVAISTGYILGGRLADQGVNTWRLNLLFVIAGSWLIFISFIKLPVLLLADFLGLRLGILCAAIILFFAPLTLLGMILPFAIKIKTDNPGEIGRTAGNIYATATLAGVFSALLTGFLLIPHFGVTRLIIFVGMVTILVAVWSFWKDRKNSKKMVTISLVLFHLGLVLSWRAPITKIDTADGQLFVEQSSYDEISVVEKDEVRYLLIDGAVRTAVRDSTLDPVAADNVVIDLCKELFFRPGKMLLIGLGGGSIVGDFVRDSWKVDAVEADPVVIDVAAKFFKLDTTRCRIYENEGRRFLQHNPNRYDFIVLDASGINLIPFHLLSTEAFQLMSSGLNPEGILAVNVEAVGWDAALIQSVAKTLRQHFQTVIALPTAEPPNVLGHVVLLAANRTLAIDDEVLGHPSDYVNLDPYLHWVVIQRNHGWANRYEPDSVKAELLTDDFNPKDLWAETINLAIREKMKETFGLQITNN